MTILDDEGFKGLFAASKGGPKVKQVFVKIEKVLRCSCEMCILVSEAEVWLFLSPARCEVPCKPGLCIHQLCDTRGQLDIGSVGIFWVERRLGNSSRIMGLSCIQMDRMPWKLEDAAAFQNKMDGYQFPNSGSAKASSNAMFACWQHFPVPPHQHGVSSTGLYRGPCARAGTGVCSSNWICTSIGLATLNASVWLYNALQVHTRLTWSFAQGAVNNLQAFKRTEVMRSNRKPCAWFCSFKFLKCGQSVWKMLKNQLLDAGTSPTLWHCERPLRWQRVCSQTLSISEHALHPLLLSSVQRSRRITVV